MKPRQDRLQRRGADRVLTISVLPPRFAKAQEGVPPWKRPTGLSVALGSRRTDSGQQQQNLFLDMRLVGGPLEPLKGELGEGMGSCFMVLEFPFG